MRAGFSAKLAATGIKKNSRLYIPYVITNALLVSILYIIAYLSSSPTVYAIKGGASIRTTMGLGFFVMAIFSVLFLFYTSAFLIKSRMKEFGLYNILGLNKKNIGSVLFFENLIIYVLSVTAGMITGIVFSKASELLLIKLVGGAPQTGFGLSVQSAAAAAGIPAVIFLLLFLRARLKVSLANPAELIKSGSVGEKPPKANVLLGVGGVLLLAGAYVLAVSLDNPIDALLWFFAAVVMVIVATYMIFISGSVLLCRLLQKNKKYYYDRRHFVSVSSLVYRMKRNGAGLASICILLTMVLVMITGSACLYFGVEDSIKNRYPRELNAQIDFLSPADDNAENTEKIKTAFGEITDRRGCAVTDVWDYSEALICGMLDKNNELVLSPDEYAGVVINYGNLLDVHFIGLEDYNRMTEQNIKLGENEYLAYTFRKTGLPERITICGVTYPLTRTDIMPDIDGTSVSSVIPAMFIIAEDMHAATAQLSGMKNSYGEYMLSTHRIYGFNTDLPEEEQIELCSEMASAIKNPELKNSCGIEKTEIYSRAAEKGDFYGTYGGVFFLGILLSVIFLTAAVVIIYYKQIAEGYEDQARFDIMQKVGMTKKDIRKCVNSQMLTVFFLPLIFAVAHLGFAFPAVRKMLLLFTINDLPLLLLTAGLSVLVAAIFYTAVYKITSNVYCSIVGGGKE